MPTIDPQTTRRRVIAADAIAATLLRVPQESAAERQAPRDEAASPILRKGELLVRGGTDRRAMAAHAGDTTAAGSECCHSQATCNDEALATCAARA